MSENNPVPPNSGADLSVIACANCHSSMPSGLRFCRNCGYRLGEGVAEYTETVRFQNGQTVGKAATTGRPNYATSYGPACGTVGASAARQLRRGWSGKMTGMTWMFVALIAIFGLSLGASQFKHGLGARIGRHITTPGRSYLGVNKLDTVDGGVTFDNVTPGSDADRAGLVGGDIITTFDGQSITSDDQMVDILHQTPIGKTVDVVYIRDGETKTTKMTTISEADLNRLTGVFRNRSQGIGRFGYDTDDAKRVEVPGTNIHGVLLKSLSPSLPADMAGVKAGDIVIEFDDGAVKTPIRTADEFEARVRRAVPYTTITVVVMRGGERLEIPVKMGRQ